MRAYEFSPRWLAKQSRRHAAEARRNAARSGPVTVRQANIVDLVELEEARRRKRERLTPTGGRRPDRREPPRP